MAIRLAHIVAGVYSNIPFMNTQFALIKRSAGFQFSRLKHVQANGFPYIHLLNLVQQTKAFHGKVDNRVPLLFT